MQREQWLLAGLMDRAANHKARTPPLDGGEDEDANTGTDTVPDDNDYIASPSNRPLPSIHQTCDLCTRASSCETVL